MSELLPTPASRKPLRKRVWFRILVMLTVVYALWCGALYFYQERLIFPGAFHDARHASPKPTLTVGKTPVYLVEPPAATPIRGLIVLLHGNDETAFESVSGRDVELFNSMGLVVAAPEYRGFPGCDGPPCQSGIVTDAAAVVDQLSKRPDLAGKPTLYLGYSLGGGVACALAEQRPPAGLILRSTFTSISSFAAGFGVPSFCISHPFDNTSVLAHFDRPVLIVQGTQDQIVPIEHGRSLAKLALHATFLELDGDHFRFKDRNKYRDALKAFVDGLLGKPPS